LPNIFVSIQSSGLDDVEVSSKYYSAICKSLSRSDPSGAINFRFGIGFEIKSGTPFYPFSFSKVFGASIGIESLAYVRELLKKTEKMQFSNSIRKPIQACVNEANIILKKSDVQYLGADWSLAPIPNSKESVAALIEAQGYTIGSAGALAVVGKLTTELKAAIDSNVQETGFNGVMLSVLEDDLLAKRYAEGRVRINDLIMYSSVCGVGVDMVPIPGDASEKSIEGIALDLAIMAYKLNKPLGLRLLPIQSKKAGASVTFNHDFLNDTSLQGDF
jgi:uncharacterized protein (UPF0210 family)